MPRPPAGPCQVDGCETKSYARKMCRMHYARFLRRGTHERAWDAPGPCSVADCVVTAEVRGYCRTHYTRWRTHGDPLVVAKAMNYGEDVGYVGAHARLRRTRGRAADLPCSQCGGPAAHWAYDHQDPDEKVGTDHGSQVPFSLDPARYLPMCVPCHKSYDLAHLGS